MARTVNLEKFLSLILRHQPQTIGISLDQNGWADVSKLVKGINEQYETFSTKCLETIVEKSEKNRFEFDVTGEKIRARQGHSVDVDLKLVPVIPPKYLYHGTSLSAYESIKQQGVNAGKRQYVHLSQTMDTAFKVGSRHGEPLVFTVLAEEMFRYGHAFYQASNGVWLTKYIPPNFLL
jgi:putative RNA 2'-phosphotransferase